MYDAFSSDYDHFVDWPSRLAAELPFIGRQLEEVGASRVLDAACGTGMHAIALAERGYTVVGTDLSAGMIERAQGNAAEAGIDGRFAVAGFGELEERVGGNFDAVLCLGNSLPHLLTSADIAAALADFARCLTSGGLLLVQNRNFDAVMADRNRWMGPQAHREEADGAESGREWLFLRFYDFEADGTIAFNVVTLRREGGGEWTQRVTATRLWPLRNDELVQAATHAGFEEVTCWGDLQGSPFNADKSGNLVLTARRHR
jgi:SAM-dependent methyltransferase